MEGCKAPIQAIESQMLGEPVFELVAPGVKGLDVGDVGFDCEVQFRGKRGGEGLACTARPCC